MPRPRTRVGEHGEIRVRELGPKKWEADGRVRLRNGRYTRIRRQGPSKTAARNRWMDRAREIADATVGKKVNGDTLFTRVMDLWLDDFEAKVERGVRAHKSLAEYRSVINGYLRPELGDLTCREAENAGLVDETLKTIRSKAAKVAGRGKNGDAAAKRARTVLSGICGYAVRHGAMDTNPVKAAEAMDHEHEEVRALEVEERVDFLEKLRAWCDQQAGTGKVGVRGRAWTDLADMAEAMLSTGCRIGEVLAIVGDGVDTDGRRVSVSHHLVRVPGVGMVRQAKRKGRRPGLTPGLPLWSLPMWRARKLASGGGPLFPSWNGGWLDPGNVAKRLARATEAIGYGWVSSRYFRHTTATHIVDSGLTNEDAADALGNTPQVVQKNYRRRQQENARVAEAMESLMGG